MTLGLVWTVLYFWACTRTGGLGIFELLAIVGAWSIAICTKASYPRRRHEM